MTEITATKLWTLLGRKVTHYATDEGHAQFRILCTGRIASGAEYGAADRGREANCPECRRMIDTDGGQDR